MPTKASEHGDREDFQVTRISSLLTYRGEERSNRVMFMVGEQSAGDELPNVRWQPYGLGTVFIE